MQKKQVKTTGGGEKSIQDNRNSKDDLYKAVALLETKDEIELFLRDLCTSAELDLLADRWTIARILAGGDVSYRTISAETGASTTTIGRVARFLQQERHQGYRIVLERIETLERLEIK